MADDPIETFRLSVMQDALPVGMAILERARKGGVSRLAEAFANSDDPLEVLRAEGEPAATTIRDQLDRLSPGLGNPVVPVKVEVDQTNLQKEQTLDQEELIQVLDRISSGMEELNSRLFDEFSEKG